MTVPPLPDSAPQERPKKIVLGVTGCIGAYKAPDLVRALRKRGFRVQVILTRAAREFVSPLSLATVSGEPVLERLFDPETPDGAADDIRHISLTGETDLFLVAPATAHAIARLALGLADDFLTTFHLALRAPTLIAPAMNTNMLEHPATRAHLETLRARGARIIAPGGGRARLRLDGGPAASPGSPIWWPPPKRRSGARRLPTSRAAGSWSPPARPASRWTRCATSRTAPRGAWASNWRAPRSTAAPR